MDSRSPGFLDSRIPGLQGLQDYKASWIPGLEGFLDSKYSWIPGFMDSRIPGFLDSRIPGLQGLQDYKASWIPGFLDSRITRIPGFQEEGGDPQMTIALQWYIHFRGRRPKASENMFPFGQASWQKLVS